MRYWLYILLAIGVLSCKNQQQQEDASTTKKDTTRFQAKIKTPEKPISLEPEARKYALQWVEFIAAQNEIDKLENSTVEDVIDNSKAISQIMQSLQISVPDSLQSIPVKARLNVVNTKAQLLDQYSHKREPDPKVIAHTASDLYEEFNNLKLQMNEIFRKTLEDFEKELDELEEREKDSLPDRLKTSF
ncbi:hypothetical protein C7S20_06885 [Christiangramia fulva]|uniref:Lipoprotein n=1 Tax=Christiangramia fulva TaxID=2126553 RepID=A0A2R3Z455_9FLAO|nr:hypothetical protein [Christiangramia fulva]AVR45018.1 hypothetical protein C7S20_06885 [Christiangramia fulva]